MEEAQPEAPKEEPKTEEPKEEAQEDPLAKAERLRTELDERLEKVNKALEVLTPMMQRMILGGKTHAGAEPKTEKEIQKEKIESQVQEMIDTYYNLK